MCLNYSTGGWSPPWIRHWIPLINARKDYIHSTSKLSGWKYCVSQLQLDKAAWNYDNLSTKWCIKHLPLLNLNNTTDLFLGVTYQLSSMKQETLVVLLVSRYMVFFYQKQVPVNSLWKYHNLTFNLSAVKLIGYLMIVEPPMKQ
jgi:hypothetical protein